VLCSIGPKPTNSAQFPFGTARPTLLTARAALCQPGPTTVVTARGPPKSVAGAPSSFPCLTVVRAQLVSAFSLAFRFHREAPRDSQEISAQSVGEGMEPGYKLNRRYFRPWQTQSSSPVSHHRRRICAHGGRVLPTPAPLPLTQPYIADWWPVWCRVRSLAPGDRWREVLRSVDRPNALDFSPLQLLRGGTACARGQLPSDHHRG
jgi:hypothetical protein